MTSLTLDNNHDIYLNEFGDLAVCDELTECLQNCKTAMLAQHGEMIYSADKGIQYRNLIWDNYYPAQFEAAARETISSITGVEKIEQFTFSRSGGVFNYRADIVTQWGRGTISYEL